MYMPSQINSFQRNATIFASIHSAEPVTGVNYTDITNKKIGCVPITPDDKGRFEISSYNKVVSITDAISKEISYFECTPAQYDNIKTTSDANTVSTPERWIIWMILWMFAVIMNFGIFLLRWSAWLMGLMLGQGVFINNELVKEAWPFVQGIANLGFIVALLYIAFATTLRLQSVSTSVQHLLPKLLIGALLVNFSLVIGGLLIDASRLFMAVEMNMFSGSTTQGQSTKITPENLGEKLLESSRIYDNVFVSSSGVFNNSALGGSGAGVDVSTSALGTWGSIFTGIRSLIFVWMVAIGLMVIALGLFWRYIMLLLLLIVSPLAYTAIALPQTEKYFQKWWSEFLKWITYGPAMLFMLIMIVRVQSINVASNPGDPATTGMYSKMVSLVVTVTLMLVAAKMATSSSGAFANSFMGMVNKTGAWARKNPKKALTIGSGGLLAPAMLGVSGAQRQVRDFTTTTGKNLQNNKTIKYVGGKIGYDKNTKSYGTQAANKMFGGLNADTVKKNEQIAAVKKNIIDGKIAKMDDDTLLPTMLGQEHVLEALDENKANNVNKIVSDGSHSQRMAIVSNKKYMEKIAKDDDKLTKLQTTIRNYGKDPKNPEEKQTEEQKKEASRVMDKMMQTIEANNNKK